MYLKLIITEVETNPLHINNGISTSTAFKLLTLLSFFKPYTQPNAALVLFFLIICSAKYCILFLPWQDLWGDAREAGEWYERPASAEKQGMEVWSSLGNVLKARAAWLVAGEDLSPSGCLDSW